MNADSKKNLSIFQNKLCFLYRLIKQRKSLVCFGLYIIATYNWLVKCNQQVKEAWSTIDTQLKRRYDLIPNLIETVKGYTKHEKSTLENIVKALNSAINNKAPELKESDENHITDNLKHIIAIAEKYPELKANEQFLELQRKLAEIEDKLQIARRYYNATVRDYNIALHSFPSNIIANTFKFKDKAYFKINAGESKNTEVNFNEK